MDPPRHLLVLSHTLLPFDNTRQPPLSRNPSIHFSLQELSLPSNVVASLPRPRLHDPIRFRTVLLSHPNQASDLQLPLHTSLPRPELLLIVVESPLRSVIPSQLTISTTTTNLLLSQLQQLLLTSIFPFLPPRRDLRTTSKSHPRARIDLLPTILEPVRTKDLDNSQSIKASTFLDQLQSQMLQSSFPHRSNHLEIIDSHDVSLLQTKRKLTSLRSRPIPTPVPLRPLLRLLSSHLATA